MEEEQAGHMVPRQLHRLQVRAKQQVAADMAHLHHGRSQICEMEEEAAQVASQEELEERKRHWRAEVVARREYGSDSTKR